MSKNIADLSKILFNKDVLEILTYCYDIFSPKIAFSSSLGVEDQVLTDIIYTNFPQARIFTLDTGRLHPETYLLIEKTNTHYHKKIEVFFPKHDLVEDMVQKKGMYSFYESVENRNECCAIRKVEPLTRALKGMDMWITGIRRDQSSERKNTSLLEWDEGQKIIKLNPLIHWSEEQVWNYIKTHRVPYNRLHDEGYPSIGCLPCTRAIEKGEDIRNGRWWWEDQTNKECGLHENPNRPSKT